MKDYFDVTNEYVIKKLRIIYLPFTIKDWKPLPPSYDGTHITPRTDVMAPDLYIPLMSFVTFIILVGVSLGALSDT